jgi:hypothetical protein
MKNLCVVVCSVMLFGGCGSSGNVSTANNLTMQSGQWEYAVVPDGSSTPMYVDFNIPVTSSIVSASNAVIFNPSVVGLPGAAAPIYCGGFNLQGSITDATLKGNMSWGQPSSHFADVTGSLAVDGKSISNGSYSGQMCLDVTGPVISGPHVKGSLTGYTITPINGTFKGILNSSLYGADVVTFSIIQNPDLTLTVSGTSVENGVTSMLISTVVPSNNSVNGATIGINGVANNINGSEPFGLIGHLDVSATQITITNMSIGTNENITGALTKQ